MSIKRCPSGKRSYASYRDAILGLDEALSSAGERAGNPWEIRVYECSCGAWHLSKKSIRRRPGRGRGKGDRTRRVA